MYVRPRPRVDLKWLRIPIGSLAPALSSYFQRYRTGSSTTMMKTRRHYVPSATSLSITDIKSRPSAYSRCYDSDLAATVLRSWACVTPMGLTFWVLNLRAGSVSNCTYRSPRRRHRSGTGTHPAPHRKLGVRHARAGWSRPREDSGLILLHDLACPYHNTESLSYPYPHPSLT